MRFLTIAVLAAGALLAPTAADGAVSPPPATGAAPVGFARLTLTDHHRTERLAVPRGGARRLPLRVLGTVDPATAVTQQRSWLLRFFDRYVR
jgi:hypothetical protein